MADVSVSHNVQFLGAWRTKVIDSGLMSTIAKQMKQLPKLPTKLTIANSGLELVILNANGEVTRTDKLPIQNVLDFINNKYSSICLLAIVKGRENHFTVFTFLFRNERDAAQMIQAYKTVKRKLSGEGFNFDLTSPKGRNWMLKPDPATPRHPNGQINVIKQGQGPVANGNVGEARVVIGEYTTRIENNGNHHDERTSHDSVATSSSEMKEELLQMSEEVRAIKQMLAEQNQQRSRQSSLNRSTSPVRTVRYDYDDNVKQYEVVNNPTQTVHFDTNVQPMYRRTTHTPERRDFGPGFAIAKSRRGPTMTKGHVAHPSIRYGGNATRMGQGQVVDGPERIVFQRTAKPRPAAVRVHSGPTSPTSTTIIRSIEEVYRPRAYSSVRARRPVIFINPSPAEQVAAVRNSPTERHFYKEQPEIVVTDHVQNTVTERVPVEVEPRVKAVYQVEQEIDVTTELMTVVQKEEEEHERSVDRENEPSTENDSRIVNMSVVESSDRLLQLEDDLEAVENNNTGSLSDKNDEDDEDDEADERRKEVIIIRKESFEEKRSEPDDEQREIFQTSVIASHSAPSDNENGENDDEWRKEVIIIRKESFEEKRSEPDDEQREIFQTSVIASHSAPSDNENDENDDEGKADSVVSDVDVDVNVDDKRDETKTKVVKRVTIFEGNRLSNGHEYGEDANGEKEEEGEDDDDEEEEPYVMDEERFKAFTSDVDVIIVEKSESVHFAENGIDNVVQTHENGPAASITENTLDFADDSDNDHDVINDFKTAKETSHTTYVVDTLVSGESFRNDEVLNVVDKDRELLDADAFRSENTVLF